MLIAGCGDLGLRIARRLLRGGHEVFGVRRRPPAGEGVRWLALDLADAGAAVHLPADIDWLLFMPTPDSPGPAAYRRTYLRSLRLLIAHYAAQPAPPQRLLHISSTRVFGADDGAWVDERTAPRPRDLQGHILLEAERIARTAPLAHCSVLRLSGLYGKSVPRAVQALREGRARRPAGVHYSNRIHRDDAARATLHLLAHPAPGGLYIGSDDRPCDQGEALDWLATRFGLPRAPQAMGRDTITGKRCDNALLRATGLRLQYPSYREGYAALLAAPDAT